MLKSKVWWGSFRLRLLGIQPQVPYVHPTVTGAGLQKLVHWPFCLQRLKHSCAAFLILTPAHVLLWHSRWASHTQSLPNRMLCCLVDSPSTYYEVRSNMKVSMYFNKHIRLAKMMTNFTSQHSRRVMLFTFGTCLSICMKAVAKFSSGNAEWNEK